MPKDLKHLLKMKLSHTLILISVFFITSCVNHTVEVDVQEQLEKLNIQEGLIYYSNKEGTFITEKEGVSTVHIPNFEPSTVEFEGYYGYGGK